MEIDSEAALTLGGSAPLILIVVSLIKNSISWLTSPSGVKFLPILCIALAYGWGAVLYVSDRFEGDLPTFIVIGLVTGMAASGLQSTITTYTSASGGAISRTLDKT